MKKKLRAIAIILMITLLSVNADARGNYEYVEPACYYVPQKIRCTCYCEHQGTATLKMPYVGIAAGKKDWMWDVAELNAINEDGSIGEFIGYFEIRDTGAGMETEKATQSKKVCLLMSGWIPWLMHMSGAINMAIMCILN